MGTFKPKSFSEPDRLKTITPHRLRAFLAPYETYLRDRGLALPSNGHDDIDYDSLAQILMHPNDRVPNAMVDTLYYVDEMANDEAMDRLMEATSAADIHFDLGPIPTPGTAAGLSTCFGSTRTSSA